MRRVSAAHCAPAHSTSGSSRSAHSLQIPSRILFHGRDNENNNSGLPLTGGRATGYWSRWKWLSDFARSLPGQVWGHCGPPSLWTAVTWLRQQSAQCNSDTVGTSWKLLVVHRGTPHSLRFTLFPLGFCTVVREATVCCVFLQKEEGIKFFTFLKIYKYIFKLTNQQ